MKWRRKPTIVEKIAGNLRLEVIFQSNSELAGSLRNALRRSGQIVFVRGQDTVLIRAMKLVPN